MPEPSSTPDPQPPQEPKTASGSMPMDAGHMPITEEMDSAKWRLPPLLPVVAAGGAIVLVLGIFVLVFSRPPATGQLLNVTSAEQVTKDSVMVAMNVSVKNVSKEAIIIKNIHAEMAPGANPQNSQNKDQSLLKDDAASAVDYDRYFQAYPALAQNKIEPLRPETTLQPGETQQGMVIVAFPLNQEAFDKRQSLKVVIDFYNHSVPAKIQQ